MPLPRRATALGLAVCLLGSLACSGSPSAPTTTLYDGTWRGTTSQMCGPSPCSMVFVVAANTVTRVYTVVNARVVGDAEGRVVSCADPGSGPSASLGGGCLEGGDCGALLPAPIENNSFGIVEVDFVSRGFINTMRGTFASASSASGSMTYTLHSVCVLKGSATWTAIKE